MISLLFSGDFAPIGEYDGLNSEYINYPFLSFNKIMSDVDLHITNLECPLTNCNIPIKKSGPHLKSIPESINTLIASNVNIACMANNHIRDFGDQGIIDTIEACKNNNLSIVGAGLNKIEAAKILYKEINGIKIAFINCCEEEFSIATKNAAGANKADPIKIFYEIKEAKSIADHVLVVFHGGHENFAYPSLRIKEFFKYCADLGASLVVGHHTHTISGYEIYKNVPLIYSLGNFVFDLPNEITSDWEIGCLLKVAIDKSRIIEFELVPIKNNYNNPNIYILANKEKKKVLSKIEILSKIIQDDELLSKEWNSYLAKRKRDYLSRLFNLNRMSKALVKRNIFKDYFIRKSNFPKLLNMFQCESHREAIIDIIKTEN